MMRLTDIHILLKQSLTGLYPDREIGSLARLVSEYVSNLNWLQIRINPDVELQAGQEKELRRIVERLKNLEPIQYIIGETEFYGIKLMVRPGVLIPRGETEELIEWSLKDQGWEGPGPFSVLDIGCGSGAITIALAKHLPDAEVYAVDVSPDALAVTLENARLNDVKIRVLLWDFINPVSIPVDPLNNQPVGLPPLSL
ncbi:MAG: HemK/PrmC family methyltransferase, partial [Bacteroidales bacterium]